MGNDYTHCADFTDDCPEECFRAQLERNYSFSPHLTYAHFKHAGTGSCKGESNGQTDSIPEGKQEDRD